MYMIDRINCFKRTNNNSCVKRRNMGASHQKRSTPLQHQLLLLPLLLFFLLDSKQVWGLLTPQSSPWSTRTTKTQNAINSQLQLQLSSPQEIIEAGVSLDTFAPQFLWLPMIVAPRAELTKNLMGGTNGILAIVSLSLVHLIIVVTAAAQEGSLDQVKIFGEVFDPSLSQLGGMQKLFQYPNFVAEEWPHVLIWDLFVGRMIWLDGLQRGINSRIALAFCNGIGPPGFLIYVLTCLISGKGMPSMDGTDKKT